MVSLKKALSVANKARESQSIDSLQAQPVRSSLWLLSEASVVRDLLKLSFKKQNHFFVSHETTDLRR